MILIENIGKLKRANREPKNYRWNRKDLNLQNQNKTFFTIVISLITVAILSVTILLFEKMSQRIDLKRDVHGSQSDFLSQYCLKTMSGTKVSVVSDNCEKSGLLRVAPVLC